MSFATFSINKASLYSKGVCEPLLKVTENGGEVTVTKVFYKDKGPAYCLNYELGGVGEYGNYDVTIEDAVSNPLVWRAIINGYPYQSFETMGVKSEDEAYTATKLAVYCVLYDFDKNNFERYTPIGEAGTRTLNAIKNIVYKARNSTQTKPDNTIKIEEDGNWIIDEIDSNYISKQFKVTSQCEIKNYTISISNDKEGQIKITDLEGNSIKETNSNKFKIMIPIKILKNDDSFEIKVNAQLKTNPVLYGNSNNSQHQNYAIAGELYEGGESSLKVFYEKNSTKLIIIKKDDKEGKVLENVKFRILNSNNEIVYDNLITDENGQIIIEGILPGKYYLEEIETKEGYKKLESRIEFKTELNQELELTITNQKKEIKKVKKLPVTGM